MILHTGSGTYFGLDPVGTRIWQMLQEGMTTATICDAIAEAYGIDPRSARADVASFLADLRAHDIVIEAP